MPMIPLQPDNGPLEAGPTTVPAAHGWLDGALAWITGSPIWIWYLLAATIITAGIIASIRIALSANAGRTRPKSDKLLTFLAAAVATGVVSTGMWKFFGDVLNIANPYARAALFAFFEIAMLASAFRSRRFRLDRAEQRAQDPEHVDNRIDVDGAAVWVLAALSGLFAAADEPTTTGKLVRVVAPLLAAWMWERGLAGELMQFTRGAKRLNLTFTVERILVKLHLAEASQRHLEDVDRDRRIARFARTAHRLHLLEETGAAAWRVRAATRSLRRQAEYANEHLALASDWTAMSAVRAQLALLYQVEDGTSRAAVADLSPFASPARKAIAANPHVITEGSQEARTEPAGVIAPSEANGSHRVSQAGHPPAVAAENGNANHAASAAEKPAAKADAKPAESVRKPSYPLADHPNDSVRKLARAYSRNPGKTNSELAKLARVSPGTANRYMAEVRAAAIDAENADADEERAQCPLTLTPFALPRERVPTGANGYSHTTAEEN